MPGAPAFFDQALGTENAERVLRTRGIGGRPAPAVVGVRGCQPELAEDVPDVLLDGPLGTTRIPAIAALERPSAIRASPSRSLAVSVPSLPVRRLAPMSCVTTSGSRAVPAAATRLSASTNSSTSAGGRFAPGHVGELTRQVPCVPGLRCLPAAVQVVSADCVARYMAGQSQVYVRSIRGP
jgi:hypothetical protein